MTAACRLLVETHGFTKLLHVHCLAHNLHRVADTIRSAPQYSRIKKLIEEVKSFFCKSGKRRRLFGKFVSERMLNVRLPSLPCPTRWATWLKSVEYFTNQNNRAALLAFIQHYQNEYRRNEQDPIYQRLAYLLGSDEVANQANKVHSLYQIIPRVIIHLQGRTIGRLISLLFNT